MLFVDLEACFLQKGYKRRHQQILEIGMCVGNKTFQRLVNPCGDNEIIAELENMGQDPVKTIRFWTKLLIGKKYLNTAVKRKSIQHQANAIRKLTSDTSIFLPPDTAMRQAHSFAQDHQTRVAHNGKSFDFHIIRAHLNKLGLKLPLFVDSLPIVRKKLSLCTHSQPFVYHHLFHDKYNAHHALDDAQALQKIWNKIHLCKTDEKDNGNTKKTSKANGANDLLSLYGVGPKSVEELNRNGIQTVDQLRVAARSGRTFKIVRKSVLQRLQ